MRRKKILLVLLTMLSIAGCLLLPGFLFSLKDRGITGVVRTIESASSAGSTQQTQSNTDHYRSLLLVYNILKSKQDNVVLYAEDEKESFYSSNNTSMIQLIEDVDTALAKNALPFAERFLGIESQLGYAPFYAMERVSTSVVTYTDIYMSKYSCRAALIKWVYSSGALAPLTDTLSKSQISSDFTLDMLMEVNSGYFIGLSCLWNESVLGLYPSFEALFTDGGFKNVLSEMLSSSYTLVQDVSNNPPSVASPISQQHISEAAHTFVYIVRDSLTRRNYHLVISLSTENLEIYISPIVEE